MLEGLQKILIAVSATIFVSVNVVTLVRRDSRAPSPLVPHSDRPLGGLHLNQTFEGTWAIDKDFSGLSRSFGFLQCAIKEYLAFRIQNGSELKEAHQLLQLKLFDSQFAGPEYVSINLRLTVLNETCFGLENWISSLFNVSDFTENVREEKTLDSWHISYQGLMCFSDKIISGAQRDSSGKQQFANAFWDPNAFRSLERLSSLSLKMTKTEAVSSPWEGQPPQFEMNLRYFDSADSLRHKCLLFSYLAIIIYFANWLSIDKFFSLTKKDEQAIKQIGLFTLLWVYLYDTKMILFIILTIAPHLDRFNRFFIIALSVAVFIFTDNKLLLSFWLSRKMTEPGNFSLKQMLVKYLKFLVFIAFLMAIFLICFENKFFTGWAIFCNSLLLVPQIAHNVAIGRNTKFYGLYIIGHCASKYFLWIITGFFQTNMVEKSETYYWQVFLGSLILVFSVVLLFWQGLWGPKGFYPAFLYAAKAQKAKERKESEGDGSKTAQEQTPEVSAPESQVVYYYAYEEPQENCAVCGYEIQAQDGQQSEELNREPSSFEGDLQQQNQQYHQAEANNKICSSVCEHVFHETCFKTWTLTNNKCPQCEAILFEHEP